MRQAGTEFGSGVSRSFNPFTDRQHYHRRTHKHDIFTTWISLRSSEGIQWDWRPAWVLRSWGWGAAKEVCAELTQGVGCSCGNFHWRSILLWVDSELGALPSKPCQPGVTRANTVLPAPVSFAKQSWFGLVCVLQQQIKLTHYGQ